MFEHDFPCPIKEIVHSICAYNNETHIRVNGFRLNIFQPGRRAFSRAVRHDGALL